MKKTLILWFIVLLAPKAVTAQEIYAVLSSDKTKLTFFYDTKKSSRSGTVYENEYAEFDGYDCPQWYASHETVTTVVFDESMKAARPESTTYWFYEFEKLKNIQNLDYLDTREVTDMSCMFTDCSSLTSLYLSCFDTGKVTDMIGMFYHCCSLTSLDLSNFDTSKVTDMYAMFYECSSLTSLDLSSFDTKNVVDMSRMFSDCDNLTSLDVSNFDTRNVTETYEMFRYCEKLTSLDLSGFDMGKVVDIYDMFDYCFNLTTIYCAKDWSKSPALKGSRDIFWGCRKLKGGMGTVFDAYDENYTDVTYARPDGGPEAPGYFTKPVNNGDVNGDGNVDVADISSVIDIMAGKLFSNKGDVNVDGNIDVADISTVIDIMAGKIVISLAPADAKAVDLGLPSGTLWANMNVGAKAQNEYGLYFAWGDTKGYSAESGHVFSWENYKWMAEGQSSWEHITKYTYADGLTEGDWYTMDYEFIGDNKTELILADDAAHANWWGEWCMPTMEHVKELLDNTTVEETTLKGVRGYKFTSKYNGNAIFLPAAGFISNDKMNSDVGYYWTSTLDDAFGSNCAGSLVFITKTYKIGMDRKNGQSIRPIIKGTKPFTEK